MVRVTVVAHPGSRHERVDLLGDDTLGVWVPQRAVEGKANAAIQTCLANALGLRPRQVEIVGGATGRRKIVELDLPDLQVLRERVLAHPVRSE
jgi:hypothetical protein